MEETGCDGVMVAESNLYNPALFAALNPPVWDIANEYLDFVLKYSCSFAAIRAHIFKIFHKV
jgi:tRNA-dihydrouridine synthase 1